MFQGVILNGEGFKIDSDLANELKSSDSAYEDVILPFIGGNEVNKDPFYNPACYVISFWDWPETKAEQFNRAYKIVETLVKPERQRKKPNGEYKLRKPLPERWWQYGEKRPALYHVIGRGSVFQNHPGDWDKDKEPLPRVIVISRGVTKYPAFTFLPNHFAFSEKLYVLADDRYSVFAILSSDLHAVWAWFQKTSMGADLYSLSYTNGDIFETFPFPSGFLLEGNDKLERLGKQLFQQRQFLMESSGKGLTKFYNDFHDPAKESDALKSVRHIQAEINEAVCQLYGWGDLDTTADFHEVGYLPEGNNVRFTVSEEARLELLRRLSKLNKAQYEEEEKAAAQSSRRPTVVDLRSDDPSLFDDEASQDAAAGTGRS